MTLNFEVESSLRAVKRVILNILNSSHVALNTKYASWLFLKLIGHARISILLSAYQSGWSWHIVRLLKDWYQKGLFSKLLPASIRFILSLIFATKFVYDKKKQQITWIFRASWIAPKKKRVLWNWISVDVTRSHVLLGF